MAVNGDVPRRLARDVPLPWAPLERYLRSTLPELEGELELFEFSHGEANRKYLARFGATELVVRRPPFGRLPPGAHDMRREHRVLSRLWEAYPRAPRAFVLCTNHDVWGADFVVMERRHGVVVRGQAPASFSGVPDLGARISGALLDAMADLHQLEPGAVGLGDLGRPDGYATRQLAGWLHRWELVCIEAVDEELRAVHAPLAATTPAPARTSIIHNDLKLDNCQFAPDDPDRVPTVFDWDMATLGDPLADLGTLL